MNFWCQMDPGFNPSAAFTKLCVFGQGVYSLLSLWSPLEDRDKTHTLQG